MSYVKNVTRRDVDRDSIMVDGRELRIQLPVRNYKD